MKRLLLGWLWLCFLPPALADTVWVSVTQSYADVHTGPAAEFPVFHVVEKGDSIEVVKSQTRWYKIRTQKGIEGWISADDLGAMTGTQGEAIALDTGTFAAYQQRSGEFSVLGGRLDNVNALTVSGAWVWTENLSAEVSYTQALGDFSENRLWLVRLQHYTFPEWRLTPYFTLGAGQIQTTPRGTLVQSGSETRTNDLLEVGVGARYYLMRNFTVRLEYKRLTALTERDEFKELNLWQLGFSVYF